MNLFAGKSRDTEVENGHMGTEEEGRGGRIERGAVIHTYTTQTNS